MHMHYLGTPFTLLATTFVAAVLAVPTNIHIRQDTAQNLADQFAITDLNVQLANDDVNNFTLNSTISEVHNFMKDFSVAIDKVNLMVPSVQAVGTLNQGVSQNIMTNDVEPLFGVLLEIALGLEDTPFPAFHLNVTDLGDLKTLVQNMSSGVDKLEKAIKVAFIFNTTQLDLVSSTTQSRFQGTAEALQAIQDDTNEINNGTLSNAG